MSDSNLDDVPPLEIVDRVPVVRLMATQRSLDHAIDAATAVIRRMVAEGQPHLLLDARDAGFDAPSLVDRLGMVRQWAEVAGGRVRIAVVAPPDFIDPERFGWSRPASSGWLHRCSRARRTPSLGCMKSAWPSCVGANEPDRRASQSQSSACRSCYRFAHGRGRPGGHR